MKWWDNSVFHFHLDVPNVCVCESVVLRQKSRERQVRDYRTANSNCTDCRVPSAEYRHIHYTCIHPFATCEFNSIFFASLLLLLWWWVRRCQYQTANNENYTSYLSEKFTCRCSMKQACTRETHRGNKTGFPRTQIKCARFLRRRRFFPLFVPVRLVELTTLVQPFTLQIPSIQFSLDFFVLG